MTLQPRFDHRGLRPRYGDLRLYGEPLDIDPSYLMKAFPTLAMAAYRQSGYNDLFHICRNQSVFHGSEFHRFSRAIHDALRLAVRTLETCHIAGVPFTMSLLRELHIQWERERITGLRMLRLRRTSMFPETLRTFIGLAEVARVFSALQVAEALVRFFADQVEYIAEGETPTGLLVWGAALCLSGALTAHVAHCAQLVAPSLSRHMGPLQVRALNPYALKFQNLTRQYLHNGFVEPLDIERGALARGLGPHQELPGPNHLRGGGLGPGLGLGSQRLGYLDLEVGRGGGIHRTVVDNLQELNQNIYGLRQDIQHGSMRRPTMMPRAMSQPAFYVHDDDIEYMSDGWP